MPLSLITETTPLLPLSNNTSTWRQTIKNWTNGFYQEIKHLVLGSLWISSAIIIIASLNIISTQVNSNEDIDFKKAFTTLIKWEVLGNTTVSLFVSFLKKCLTNFGNSQLEKTLFYKIWNKIKDKVFTNTIETSNLNFEEIKTKINVLEANKNTLVTQIKEFSNLCQQLVTKFKTLLNNNTENDIILTIEENINNNLKAYSIITNELIKIIATFAVFTSGVAFASSISIIKNDIANDLPLNPTSFVKTFTALETIIVSFLALIIFKLKFNLFENGLKNIKHSLLWQCIKKIINKPTISEADIELEYEKITALKRWYDLNFIKLEFNLNEIQNILEIQTLNPNNNYNSNICKNIKYLFTWLISIVSSMTLDSYFDIITAQISANKKIDFIKDLKLLITKENIIVAIIAQIGFSFKLNITDFCWEKFKNTYTCQALSYICNFPKNIISLFTQTIQFSN
ncbi:hypothetical protein [Spiroplasma endosymbiont of Andrena trimmerana]|uniref:hypothetical protein n=1 Tax=Spiroplasma endosymbiont of Andrena trimmerana TaxID=3066316 RepID=UPI0030D513FB